MKKKLNITGMHCAACAMRVEDTLRAAPGVTDISVNFATKTANVEFNENEVSLNELKDKIKSAGYEASQIKQDETGLYRHALKFALLICLPSWLLMLAEHYTPFGHVSGWYHLFLAAPVVFYSGFPFYSKAIKQLFRFSFSMDLLITLGVFASFFSGLLSSFNPDFPNFIMISGMLIAVQLAGRYIEELAREKALKNIGEVSRYMPQKVTKLVDNFEVEESLGAVKPGDILVIKPGDKIPVDGVVTEGKTTVDESVITGEYLPQDKTVEDRVIGGSVNIYGVIKVRAEKVASESFFSKIVDIVNDVTAAKPRLSAVTDNVIRVFIPVVIVFSAAAFLGWLYYGEQLRELVLSLRSIIFFIKIPEDNMFQNAVYAAVSTLVIACPCALGIATPMAMLAGVDRGIDRGFVIKNITALEKAGHIRAVCFDKTGTVISKDIKLSDIILASGYAEEDLITLSATIESASKYPPGQAIVLLAKEKGYTPGRASEVMFFPGKGLSGKVSPHTHGHLKRWGKTPKEVLLGRKLIDERNIRFGKMEELISKAEDEGKICIPAAVDGEVKGVFVFTPEIQSDAVWAVRKLTEKKITVFLISGDNEKSVEQTALSLGISRFYSGVSPERKKDILKEIRGKFGPVVMAGDGINDAPALAFSDIGMAIGKGFDIVTETGDVIILKESLRPVVEAIYLMKAIYSKIKFNLFWAFFYNIVFIPLAMLSTINPVIAEICMMASSISVILSSRTLSKWHLK